MLLPGRSVVVSRPKPRKLARDHQPRSGQAGDHEGRRPRPGERLDRAGFTASNRTRPPAEGEHLRWAGGAGDDPGRLRIGTGAGGGGVAAEESTASGGGG